MTKGRKLTEKDYAFIRREYRKHITIRNTAKKTGYGISTVKKAIQR